MSSVLIYTKGYCPYCSRAKALLDGKKVTYQEVAIDTSPERREEMIKKSNGGYTVPQIFINDDHIGGCDDIMALEYQGKLDELLID